MRKILLTTTALIALGSVSAVAADVSLSGNMRFRYNSWSDDNAVAAGENNNSMSNIMQLWVKSSATTDNGLSIGTNTRFRKAGNIDRNWIDINGDFGSIDLGQQWSPSYSASLHENWEGTVAGGVYMGGSNNGAAGGTGLSAMNTTGFVGGTTANKVIYSMPAVGGFSASVGFGDAGADSDGDETSTAITYTMPMMDNSLKLVYANIKTDGANATSADNEGTEIGVEYSGSFGRVYVINQNTTTTTVAGAKTNDQEGTTFGGTYNVNGATKVVYYRQEMDQDGTTDLGDKFSSDTVGIRYDIAGGLRIGLLHSSYDFTDAGTYSVTATDSSGCSSTVDFGLTVLEAPTAAITETHSANAYFFDGTSSLYISQNTTYNWDFGYNNLTATTPTATVTYPWSDPSSPVTYTVTLSIDNGCGTDVKQKDYTPDPLGIDATAEGSFGLYPNPANDNVNFVLDGAASAQGTVQVMDISGRVLTSQIIAAGQINGEINLAELASGSYLVKISVDGNSSVNTLIKQ